MTRKNVFGLRDLVRRCLAHEIADHGPVRRRFGGGNEIFQMRAHCVRHPAQQHDRDVALAAFELGDIAFGNTGDFCQHLARHAAQRPHGADTLAELFEKAGFGIEGFGHAPLVSFSVRRTSLCRGRSRSPAPSSLPVSTRALIRPTMKSSTILARAPSTTSASSVSPKGCGGSRTFTTSPMTRATLRNRGLQDARMVWSTSSGDIVQPRVRVRALGNIMPRWIDSKRAWCLSMNYNS
jgi:hypothetical protein